MEQGLQPTQTLVVRLGQTRFFNGTALFDHKDLKFRFLTDQLIGAEDAGRAGADDDYIIQIIFAHKKFSSL